MSNLVRKTDSVPDQEFSLKSYFVPLTTVKAIHWIIILGILVYCNSLFNGFVGDDNAQIITNPAVHSISNFFMLFRGSTQYLATTQQFIGLYYKPLLSISYSAIYTLFGANPFFFHLFQLSLHISNSILIFLILKKFLRISTAFVLSLLFLLHPINNEAIVYIANLQDVLFPFFGLLALKFLIEKKSVILIGIMLFLSLLSKESGIIFFFILIVYYVLYAVKSKRKNLFFVITLLIIFVVYLYLRIVIGNIGLQTKSLYMSDNATFIQRLYTIPSLILYYFRTAFFPVTIVFGWYWVVSTPTFTNFGFPLLLVILLGIVLLLPLYFLHKRKEKYKAYLFFLFIVVISLGISMQIVPLDFTVADRWFYIPLFGLLGLFGIWFDVYCKHFLQNNLLKKYLLIVVIMILIFFMYKDFTRNTVWVSNIILCGHDLQSNPQSYLLQYCYANELFIRKNYKPAILHAKEAVKLYPDYFLAWDTVGESYYALGDTHDAQTAFEKTLSLNDYGYGSQELALVYAYENKPKQAIKIVQTYLKITPKAAELWYAFALANYEQGRENEAITAAKEAYLLEPVPLTYKVYYRLERHQPLTFK